MGAAEDAGGGEGEGSPGATEQETIAALTHPNAITRPYFRVTDDRLVSLVPVAPGRENELDDLLRELVDWRLAKHRARTDTAPPKSFDCGVMWNQRDPILKLPPRARHPDLPQGDTHVRLPDGSSLLFRFQKEFINVAHAAGDRKNRLPDLLRSFYGPNAGRPGTDYRVRFESSPDGLWLRGLGEVVDLGAHRRLYRAHPDLRADAGAATGPQEEIETDRVALPIDREGADLFAVRAAGSEHTARNKSPLPRRGRGRGRGRHAQQEAAAI